MAEFKPHSEPTTVEVPPHLQASLAALLADGGHCLSPLPSEHDTDLPAYEIRELSPNGPESEEAR